MTKVGYVSDSVPAAELCLRACAPGIGRGLLPDIYTISVSQPHLLPRAGPTCNVLRC